MSSSIPIPPSSNRPPSSHLSIGSNPSAARSHPPKQLSLSPLSTSPSHNSNPIPNSYSTSHTNTNTNIQSDAFGADILSTSPSALDPEDPLLQMPLRPAPSTFLPFFTLISDTTNIENETPSTHHPARIHYIFEDDDTEGLIEACVRASSSATTFADGQGEGSHGSFEKKGKGKEIAKGREREERVILIDMASSGDSVVRAQSLSEKWQVTNCEIGKAPIWEEGEDGEEGKVGAGGGGLMLKIEGTGITRERYSDMDEEGKGKGKEKEGDNADVDMERLLDGFDKKMAVLRKVLGGVGWVDGAAGGGDDNAIPEDMIGEVEQEREATDTHHDSNSRRTSR